MRQQKILNHHKHEHLSVAGVAWIASIGNALIALALLAGIWSLSRVGDTQQVTHNEIFQILSNLTRPASTSNSCRLQCYRWEAALP